MATYMLVACYRTIMYLTSTTPSSDPAVVGWPPDRPIAFSSRVAALLQTLAERVDVDPAQELVGEGLHLEHRRPQTRASLRAEQGRKAHEDALNPIMRDLSAFHCLAK
jgi:hypothetical protein